MRAGYEPLRNTVLVPGVFHVYLCSADLSDLRGILNRIRQEAFSTLDAELAQLNRGFPLPAWLCRFLGIRKKRYLNASDTGWQLEFSKIQTRNCAAAKLGFILS